MKYTPLFKDSWQSHIFGIASGAAILFSGIGRHSNMLIGLGLTIIIVVIVVMLRFYVVITDEMLEARGFFFARRIRWADIQDVKHISKEKGPVMYRLFGMKYKFIAVKGVVRINFRWFPKACYDEVFKRVSTR